MNSKQWFAACTGVQARDGAKTSPDGAPALRGSGFAAARMRGGLRRCLAGRANPRDSVAVAAVLRLAAPPAKPLSGRAEIGNTS